jgi:hypothetical protein
MPAIRATRREVGKPDQASCPRASLPNHNGCPFSRASPTARLLLRGIVLTATALCINSGGNHPKAVNKGSFSAEGTFPVQNGKANYSLTLTATFQPDCSPPMTVTFTDVQVCDTTNSICQSFGTF